MKGLALLLVLVCNLSFSQVDNSDNQVQVRYLDLDIVNEREIRITKINYLGVTHVLQIFFSENKTWHYRLAARLAKGFAIYEEDSVSGGAGRFLFDLALLKSIPNQRAITLRYQDGTEMSEDKVAAFFERVMDGSAYKVEFWDYGICGEVRYENPDVYVEILQRHKFSTVDHERFNQFISYYEEIYGPLSGYDRLTKALKGGK